LVTSSDIGLIQKKTGNNIVFLGMLSALLTNDYLVLVLTYFDNYGRLMYTALLLQWNQWSVTPTGQDRCVFLASDSACWCKEYI